MSLLRRSARPPGGRVALHGHGLRDRLVLGVPELGATPTAVVVAAALTMHLRRRVRKDGTVDVASRVWQLDQAFLAGRVVTVIAAHADLAGEPVVLHDGHRYDLHPADPVAASRTRRRRRGQPPPPTVPFDPPGALLDKAAGRTPRHYKEKP